MAVKQRSARTGRERRGSERADAKLSMRVEAGIAAGPSQIVTESQNISASGIYCLASHYLAPLSKVQLTIVLPSLPGRRDAQELVKCEGIVVRCSQRPGDKSPTPYELACMFSGLDRELRSRVEEFVTWRNLQALRAALAPEKPEAARKPRPQSAPVKAAAKGPAPRKKPIRKSTKPSAPKPSSKQKAAQKKVVKQKVVKQKVAKQTSKPAPKKTAAVSRSKVRKAAGKKRR